MLCRNARMAEIRKIFLRIISSIDRRIDEKYLIIRRIILFQFLVRFLFNKLLSNSEENIRAIDMTTDYRDNRTGKLPVDIGKI